MVSQREYYLLYVTVLETPQLKSFHIVVNLQNDQLCTQNNKARTSTGVS